MPGAVRMQHMWKWCVPSALPLRCAAGVLPPSGGDALVYGESLTTPGGMDRIRRARVHGWLAYSLC